LDERISSGIEGLNQLLDGGFLAGRNILVIGGPGSGKSILGTQFIVNNIGEEPSIYVSLDYSKKTFLNDMNNFGWDFAAYEEDKKFIFIDGSSIRKIPQTKNVDGVVYSEENLSLEDIIDLIQLNIDKIGAKKIILDDLTGLLFRYPSDAQRRSAMLHMFDAFAQMNITAIIISEASMYDVERTINTEEFLSDGVIRMVMLKDGTRSIQISKMRGVNIDNKPHPYTISSNGIEVFATEQIFSS